MSEAPPSRHSAVFRTIRPNGAVILLGLICALAAIEIIAAFLAYRSRDREADWEAIDAIVTQQPPAPVLVADEWLGPRARMHLSAARRWDALAPPDLRGFDRFWILTDARGRPWQSWLRAELEELHRPKLLAVHTIGDLALHEYRQDAGELRFALLESVRAVVTPAGRCRAGANQWSCKDGRVAIRTVEVNYRPRRCVVFELDDGVMARLDLGQLDLGDRIYGHVGFADFNDRLRADPSAQVELWIDGEVAGRWLFSDDQGWASFAMRTPPGTHAVELRAGVSAAGTWQRDGHRNSPTDSLCVELRGFMGGHE